MASQHGPERVEFYTVDGTVLRGDLYAVNNSNAPIVVMTQGVCGIPIHSLTVLTLSS